ncbi:hypothetical protein LUCX_233 [Xanthomonas phage vB_XciM_LucasX]|nr:hypothetical protein LUCX_233 [Xanthomonas phage vB_XciM_LucasX]
MFVLKKDGSKEPFDLSKIPSVIMTACDPGAPSGDQTAFSWQLDLSRITWRMRVRILPDFYRPAFLTHGPETPHTGTSLAEILEQIRQLHTKHLGKVALSFTRDHEEFYSLGTHREESQDEFITKCGERITWFCERHQIPLSRGG